MRSFPSCGVRVLHPAQYDVLDSHHGDRQKIKKNVPWLSSLRSDWHVYTSLPTNANPNIHVMFYSVGANRGQLLHIYSSGGGRKGRGARGTKRGRARGEGGRVKGGGVAYS